MKVTVDVKMFIPTLNNAIYLFVGMMKFFRMQHNGFIGIFKQVGQYYPQDVVAVGNVAVKVKMR